MENYIKTHEYIKYIILINQNFEIINVHKKGINGIYLLSNLADKTSKIILSLIEKNKDKLENINDEKLFIQKINNNQILKFYFIKIVEVI